VQDVLVRAGALSPKGEGRERAFELMRLGEVAGAVRANNQLWIASAILQLDYAQQPSTMRAAAAAAAAGEGEEKPPKVLTPPTPHILLWPPPLGPAG